MLAGGLLGLGGLVMLEHVAMLLGMLLAMVLRPAEYTCGHNHHAAQEPATA